MSVAGIFKEVATISVSAWIFGDRLTLLNLVGAFIAFCGK
jgi:solute carrier family 35, member C2